MIKLIFRRPTNEKNSCGLITAAFNLLDTESIHRIMAFYEPCHHSLFEDLTRDISCRWFYPHAGKTYVFYFCPDKQFFLSRLYGHPEFHVLLGEVARLKLL